MTMRTWTKEELDRVWPPPDGCHWRLSDVLGWVIETDDEKICVWAGAVIGERPRRSTGVGPDVVGQSMLEAVLAVASVALGLDSREAIAAKMDARAKMATSEANAQPDHGRMLECEGQAHAWKDSAEMVRRGTVKP